MESHQSSVDKGHEVTQINGIQIIANVVSDFEIEYLYVDTENERNVLHTKENIDNGLISVLEIDRDYWQLTYHGMKLNKPYKILALVKKRVLHITPV